MNKKIIYKTISYLIILFIFFFLGKGLISNWQKVKGYQFSFNYFYLILSFLFLSLGIIVHALVWNSILTMLEPEKKVSNSKILKVFIYSWFGKYLPGRAWMYLGRVHLGGREGIDRKNIAVSVAYEIILSTIAMFLFSLIFLTAAFGKELFEMKLYSFYIISILIIPIGLFLARKKNFYFICNFFLRKFKKMEISKDRFLNYREIIRIILYHFIIYSINGIAFFFLLRSLVYLPFYDIIGVIGIFILASALGMMVIFVPSGLGVRESVLAMLLQLCFSFPLSVAILISLVARLWATLGEVITFICIYLYSKYRNI